MKGLIVTKEKKVVLSNDIPMPQIGPYEALVKTECCMICNGTDLEIIRGELPEAQLFPTVLGHESVGRIVALGEKVRTYRLGDMVIRGSLPENDLYHSAWGGFAEYCVVCDSAAMAADGLTQDPRGLTQQIVPDGIAAEEAALMITLKETCSAVRRIGINPEDPVLVVGDGPVGLCMICNLKLIGVKTILVVGNRPSSLEIAKQVGATQTYLNRSKDDWEQLITEYNKKIAVYVDTIGTQETIVRGTGLVRQEGKVAVYGLRTGSHLNLPVAGLRNFSLQFVQWPIEQYEMQTHDFIANAILNKQIPTEKLISHVLPVARFEEGFSAIVEKRALKVALRF